MSDNTDNFLNRVEKRKRLEEYFRKNRKKLIKQIMDHNGVDTLFLTGTYESKGTFGFFKNIRHEEGEILEYPVILREVRQIYTSLGNLKNDKTYLFPVQIATKFEREKKLNPFLLESKPSNVKEIEALTTIQNEIRNKEQRLIEISNAVKENENLLEKKVNETKEKAKRFLHEKQNEVDTIIDGYNSEIETAFADLKRIEKQLEDKNDRVFAIERLLENYSLKKVEMEETLKFLKSKIELCRNLEFLSSKDADNYLLQLKSTVVEFSKEHLDFEKDLECSFSELAKHILQYLYFKKGLVYTKFQIVNFITLLLTNDIVVLSGLSGSGKTQIVKSVAEAIGGVAKIIPVKPNWTSSDDLLGFYNPIQSSFLPTPFTEAISEARQNPHRMYLICLDEMNLARAEYYFADFLSKLEERSKQPEIELYAKHEEELFLSEFKILLSLIESSTSNKEISSWRNFLEDDEVRNRFFDLIGNKEDDNMLQVHSKMRRRLIDILKFPSTIKLPQNVRFIGAINVDETTHYFSPKILDRVHIVKFENPLLFDNLVSKKMSPENYHRELKPVYVDPLQFGKRNELPSINDSEYGYLTNMLKDININYLLPLSIDFGVRSIRQAINYARIFDVVSDYENIDLKHFMSFNAIILQKILPRFLFEDGPLKNGLSKVDVLKKFKEFLEKCSAEYCNFDVYESGCRSEDYLDEMLSIGSHINFWAISSITENVESSVQDSNDKDELKLNNDDDFDLIDLPF